MKSLSLANPFSFFKSSQLLHWQRLYALKSIMAQEKMKTFFQPIYDVQANQTFGFEALNRPDAFPIFENTDDFYEFVGQTKKVFSFEQFCRNLSIKRYHKKLTEQVQQKSFTLFLNIHPHVLLDKNYHSGETLSLLRSFGIEPQHVVFELTERSAVTDFQEFSRVLSNYRKQGYRIAVDDVGSGYNSLKTLIYLKPEFIKIDRSLISYIDTEVPQQQLLAVILNYAAASHTKVIAEGIERIEEYQFIRDAGVHYAQGYALGRPHEQLLEASAPLCD